MEEKWNELNAIKQKSNLYAVLGLSFKRDLLSIDKDYLQKYNPNNVKPVGDDDIDRLVKAHKKFDPIDVLAFIEHERWNAFELANGVLPMKKSMFMDIYNSKKDKSEVENKTPDGNYHLCITTQNGLVEYYKLFKKLKLKDPNVIGWDYDSMDNFVTHCHLLEGDK